MNFVRNQMLTLPVPAVPKVLFGQPTGKLILVPSVRVSIPGQPLLLVPLLLLPLLLLLLLLLVLVPLLLVPLLLLPLLLAPCDPESISSRPASSKLVGTSGNPTIVAQAEATVSDAIATRGERFLMRLRTSR
jgi:hypothetical protein